MSRRIARETVMQAYYQMEIHQEYDADVAKKFIDGVIESDNDKKYIYEMVDLFIENRETIDNHIHKNLKGWSIDRLSKIDLSILRVGLAEMFFRNDIPVKVSINEAIELGKKYGADDSFSFISGLLGAVAKSEGIDE